MSIAFRPQCSILLVGPSSEIFLASAGDLDRRGQAMADRDVAEVQAGGTQGQQWGYSRARKALGESVALLLSETVPQKVPVTAGVKVTLKEVL